MYVEPFLWTIIIRANTSPIVPFFDIIIFLWLNMLEANHNKTNKIKENKKANGNKRDFGKQVLWSIGYNAIRSPL